MADRTLLAGRPRAVVGLAVALVLALVAGCRSGAATPDASQVPSPTPGAVTSPASPAPTSLVMLTHDSFAISDGVLEEFAEQSGAHVEVLRSGDAGSMVNQAILTRDAPLADVLYGIDNSFLSRALDAGLFEPFRSPLLADVPDGLEVDPDARVTPIDYGDVCLNYDKEAFGAALPAPGRLEDLVQPAYRGMLVVENPATSSPGLAFLLATVARFGEEGGYTWRDFWRGLVANDVLVESNWNSAYYGSFSGGAGEGDRPIVVSYASSPVAEVAFAPEPQPAEAPTAVVTDGCFRQIEFAGILAGTDRTAQAQAFIDFMLGTRFQEDIPLNMFVLPANSTAALPDVFVRHGQMVPAPLVMDPFDIGRDRDRWIEEWTDVVLR